MNDKDTIGIQGDALKVFFEKQSFYLLEDEVKTTETPVNKEDVPKNEPQAIQWEGLNINGFWMFFNHGHTSAIHPDWSDMIMNLVENPKAMNKKLEDMGCVNLRLNPGFDWLEFKKAHLVKKVIFWGEKPASVPADLTIYEPQQSGDVTLMLVDLPEKIKEDRSLKNQLWTQLQKAFL